ncbi:hypothetical protein KI387_023307, partial [Taxus chinensis]
LVTLAIWLNIDDIGSSAPMHEDYELWRSLVVFTFSFDYEEFSRKSTELSSKVSWLMRYGNRKRDMFRYAPAAACIAKHMPEIRVGLCSLLEDPPQKLSSTQNQKFDYILDYCLSDGRLTTDFVTYLGKTQGIGKHHFKINTCLIFCLPNGGIHNSKFRANFSFSDHDSYVNPFFHRVVNSLMGKMAANQGHTWIYRDQLAQPELKYLQNSHPRTWEAQFHSGIQTIALVAVKEGVLQLGSTQKVTEDLKYVIFLQRVFKDLLSAPGVLPPHPSSQPHGTHEDGEIISSQKLKSSEDYRHPQNTNLIGGPDQDYNFQACAGNLNLASHGLGTVVPSMSSLQALLSKLPSVTPSSSDFPSSMQQPAEDNMDVY